MNFLSVNVKVIARVFRRGISACGLHPSSTWSAVEFQQISQILKISKHYLREYVKVSGNSSPFLPEALTLRVTTWLLIPEPEADDEMLKDKR